jgi:arabinofuranosyltransferase
LGVLSLFASDGYQRWARYVGLALFLLICFRSAWMADDAFITLRTVDNFVNGYGLTWNVSERVQTYTHPLWMFLLSAVYAITQEAYLTTLVVSLIVSFLAAVLAVNRVPRWSAGILVLACLVSSKAYVDYSTSGLENPLTHLILAGFLWTLTRNGRIDGKMFGRLCLLAALGTLNRMDTLLLFLPSLILVGRNLDFKEVARRVGTGFAPLIGWFAFSTIYYGFPFPNTAYAKLKTGIPTSDMIEQGLRYVHSTWIHDPLTLVLIVAGLGVASIRRDRVSVGLSAGIVLYLVYVVRVGGDFMTGRFLTGPFLLSLACIARGNVPDRLAIGGSVIVVAISLLSPLSPLRSGSDYYGRVVTKYRSGVIDERAIYFQRYGLLSAIEGGKLPTPARRITFEPERRPVVRGDIGFSGFSWGPNDHIIDLHGLADPLLSRLPNHDLDWRIGHFRRLVPRGYAESIATGENKFEIPALGRYYEGLKLITRGDIWSADRWEAILAYNVGTVDSLLSDRRTAQALVYESVRVAAQDKTTDVIGVLQQATRLDPEYGEAAYLLSRALRESGRFQEAEALALRACKLRPDRYKYFHELSRVALEHNASGHPNEAIGLFSQGTQISREYLTGYLNLGFGVLQLGNPGAALSMLARALRSNPNSGEKIKAGIEEHAESPEFFDELIRLIPFDPKLSDNWVRLHRLLERVGDRQDSWDPLLMGLKKNGFDQEISEALLAEVRGYLGGQQWVIAGDLLEQIAEQNGSIGIVYYYSGIVNESLGQTGRAVEAHTRSVELAPGEPLARQSLIRALQAAGLNDRADEEKMKLEALVEPI